MTSLLARIWRDEAGPAQACAEVRRVMALQVWPHRLTAGFPADVVLAGKTRTLPSVHNEVAVVTYPDARRYAVVVYTRSRSYALRQPQLDRPIGEAGRLAVEALRGQATGRRGPLQRMHRGTSAPHLLCRRPRRGRRSARPGFSAADEARRRATGEPCSVTSTLPDTSAVATACADAERATARAGVRVLPLDTLAGVRDAADLFARVWRTDPSTPPLAAEVMRAVEHAGGYVVGAYADDVLVGASSGFLGLGADGRPVLHSHISGVVEQGRGVGTALKLHQRAWALHRGITAITWTFDPLVRRNAWFNLVKLGATGVEYLPDFYGPMTDGVNGGESSDRLFTRWDLTAAPAGPLDADGGTLLLDEVDGAPVPTANAPEDADLLVLRLPADVEALRTADAALATAWRLAVRRALVPAFADGFTVRGMTADARLVLAR